MNVFTLVGIVCALLVCGSLLLVPLASWYNRLHNDYYCALREQISETSREIDEVYGRDGLMTADAARLIINLLNARRMPNIREIKVNDSVRIGKLISSPPTTPEGTT